MSDNSWFSTLNIDQYVQGLMADELAQINGVAQSQIVPLQSVQVSLNAQLGNYSNVNKLFTTLSTDINALNGVFNPTPTISTSNPNVAAATQIVGQTLNSGSHNLNVANLATASTYASNTTPAISNPNAVLNSSDTITVQMANSGPSFQVAVNPTTDTLQSVCNEINTQATANSMGVTASIVQSSSGSYQLMITSSQTGVANGITVTDNSSGSATPLGIAETQSAADASFTFDGVSVDSASNSNIAIGSLNVNLLGTGLASINVTTSSPTSAVVNATQTVVNDYNNLMIELSKDQVTEAADPSLSNIQLALQNLMQSTNLPGLGISFQDNTQIQQVSVTLSNGSSQMITPSGIVTLDTGALTTALSNNFASVQSALTAPATGIMTQMNSMITAGGVAYNDLYDSQFGAVTQTQNQLNTVGTEITQVQNDFATQQQNLKIKYGSIEAMLATMQLQSEALSAQISSLNSSS